MVGKTMLKLHSKSDKTGPQPNPNKNNKNIDRKHPDTLVVNVENPGFESSALEIESTNSNISLLISDDDSFQISPLA